MSEKEEKELEDIIGQDEDDDDDEGLDFQFHIYDDLSINPAPHPWWQNHQFLDDFNRELERQRLQRNTQDRVDPSTTQKVPEEKDGSSDFEHNSLEPYSGVFIGGPKAGEYLIHNEPYFRVRTTELPTLRPSKYKEPSVTIETFTYEWTKANQEGGYWIPLGWTEKQIVEEVLKIYTSLSTRSIDYLRDKCDKHDVWTYPDKESPL